MTRIGVSQPMFLVVVKTKEKRGIISLVACFEINAGLKSQSICAGEGGATRASTAANLLVVP